MKIKLLIKPAIVPTHVLLGLTSGKIFFSPNFLPKKNAEVSQIQTERKSAMVTLNPISGRFLRFDKDPSIRPNQTKANTNMEILSNGFSCLRNISIIIPVRVIPIINK